MDKLKVPSRIGQCRIIHCGTYINKIQYLTFGTVLEVIKYRLCVCESQSFVSDFLRPHGLYSPWNSPGQNARVGSLSLLQGIFPTQGSNPGLPHCRWILYQLSHKGSLRILEWEAYPSPGGLPDPGIKLGSPALQADSLPTELSGKKTEHHHKKGRVS